MSKKYWIFCIISLFAGVVGIILALFSTINKVEKPIDYNLLSPGGLLDAQLNLEQEISGLNNERIVVEQMKLDKINQVRGVETPTSPSDELTKGLNL